MTTLTATHSDRHLGASWCAQNCSFKDDSALPMALTVIPVVGHIVHHVKYISIENQLKNPFLTNAESVELIKTLGKYSYCAIGRELLQLVGVITLLALGLINPILGGIAAVVFGICAITNLGIGIWAQKKVEHINTQNDLPGIFK